MTLKDKLNIFLNALKESRCILYNGFFCLYSDQETTEDNISFDDIDGDDYYTSIKVSQIKDIEIKNGSFKIIFNNDEYVLIHICIIKRYSFDCNL